MSWFDLLIGALLILYTIVCLLLITIILMQRSKQEGLGSAFGSTLTDSVFGARTSNILVKGTVWLTSLFFALTIVLAYLYAQASAPSVISRALNQKAPAPLTQEAPTPSSQDLPDSSEPAQAPTAPSQ